MTVARRSWFLLLAWLALAATSSAHRLDEYLQATLVAIEPGDIRLQINLVPGVAVAEQVIQLIDANGNGEISKEEAATYAETLQRNLIVRLDGLRLDLHVTISDFPVLSDLRTGAGVIQLEYALAPATFVPGSHRIEIEDGHLGKISVYLLNTAMPKDKAVHITKQDRNENQSKGAIGFTFDSDFGSSLGWKPGSPLVALVQSQRHGNFLPPDGLKSKVSIIEIGINRALVEEILGDGWFEVGPNYNFFSDARLLSMPGEFHLMTW